jgi:alkyldihydroxyacetonephosphate synthase
LPPHALAWLSARVGVGTPMDEVAVAVSESALSEDAFEALEAVAEISIDSADRLGRAGGLSYLDLIKRRGHGELAVPDAVVLPGSPEEVQEVLRVCVEHDVSVVPFGGGTSVVGGVEALRGGKEAVIALDLQRLDRLVSVDAVSRVAVLQAGVTAPDAEKLLAQHGFTLGHVPQSFERATIGGFAATRSAGQASSGYGRFEDMVEGVRVQTPVGEWKLGAAPASAAGPDLQELVIGSEGLFGVITEVAVRVRPKVENPVYEGLVVDGWDAGVALIRDLAQRGALADVTRLSDVDETEVAIELSGGSKAEYLKRYLRLRGIKQPCLVILGWEGRPRSVTMGSLHGHRFVRLGRAMGEAWRHGRFNGPRQRDALLDSGVCVETLETATHWSKLPELYAAVRGALTSALGAPVIMCHISHAYETGASLYFTVLVPRSDEPVSQWQQAKTAACEAISGLGTITHHHAVGRDHAPYLRAEIGELGVDVLRAVKDRLDPTGILNPGKLV